MFDIAPSEFLLIAIVAIVVIGPKDLPLALRTAGQWIARVRRVSNHFKAGVETMMREAEMEEMERKWREQNAAIMATTATGEPMMIDHAADAVPGYSVPDYAHHDPETGPVDPLLAAHAPTDPVHMMPLAQPPGTNPIGPDSATTPQSDHTP